MQQRLERTRRAARSAGRRSLELPQHYGAALFERPTFQYPKQGAVPLLKRRAAIQGAPMQRDAGWTDIRGHYFTERARAVPWGLRAAVKPESLEVLTRESPEQPGVIPELTPPWGHGWARDLLRFPPVPYSYTQIKASALADPSQFLKTHAHSSRLFPPTDV